MIFSVQYDGLETTSNVISGIFAMATATGEAPAITSVSKYNSLLSYGLHHSLTSKNRNRLLNLAITSSPTPTQWISLVLDMY